MTRVAAPARIAREALVGTWRMRSWTRELVATGERSEAFGPDPHGFITYGGDGRMMVLVVRSDREPPADLLPTPEEKLALFDSMFAYGGTYSVEADKVTHHLDLSWNQILTGTDLVRFCTIAGDALIYKGAPARDPMDGQECVYTVIFEKVAGAGGPAAG